MATLTKSTGTVALSGAVEKVTFPAVYGWVWVKNMSDSDMFAGLSESVSAGADGVMRIPAGECGRIQTDGQDSVYLMGTGNALVVAQNYADCPFKLGGKGGEIPDLSAYALKSKYGDTTIDVGRLSGSTVGEYSTAEGMKTTASGQVSKASGYYTEALGDYSYSGGFFAKSIGHSSFAYGNRARTSKNNEVAFGIFNISNDDTLFSVGDGKADNGKHNAFEITTTGGKLHDKDIAVDVSNPNLLINPDFKINQRGVSGTFSETGKYFVDRWRLVSGAVTVNADGTLTLNGTISQIFENAVGDNVTASVSAGTATYDDSTKTFSITANGEIISWAKLEYGSNATQFFPPDMATELMKCKRFYRTLNRGTLAYSSNSNSVVFVETFDMPMRVNPDVKILSTVKLTYCNGWIDEPNVSDMSIISVNITKMGVCYLQVGGFNMTVNGNAFAENSSFRAATDNFIGLDAEIY